MKRVYVMEGLGKVKVGRSSNPEIRRLEVMRMAKEDLALRYSTDPLENSSEVELGAHDRLREHLCPGECEWFSVAPQVAIQAIQESIKDGRLSPPPSRIINIRVDEGIEYLITELRRA